MLFGSLFVFIIGFLDHVDCLSCFKCMTTNFDNDTCSDPFHPIDNHLEAECLATSNGKNGVFPARFCVKISGVVVDVDRNVNRSLLRKSLFLRTCIIDNIMDSTRSSDSTGNFRLKNFNHIKGVRMQGTITVCSHDGCNRGSLVSVHRSLLYSLLLLCIVYYLK